MISIKFCDRVRILYFCTSSFIFFLNFGDNIVAQTINWKFLPKGESNGACISSSDYSVAKICYGMEYVPSQTGVLTSYTMGFFVECLGNDLPIVTSTSCSMIDNTTIFDDCGGSGSFLIQMSGNTGNLNITAGQPIIIHQVCIDFHYLDSLDITLDDLTGVSMSIDLPNGESGTDDAPFAMDTASYQVFGIEECDIDTDCSIYFSSNQLAFFDTLVNGSIVIADTTSSRDVATQAFNVYDEINKFCGVPGGATDVNVTLRMVHTYDTYQNGLIDTYVGNTMKVTQGEAGILAHLPFNMHANSQSTSGDVRGIEMDVDFVNHLCVRADQIQILLNDLFKSSKIFTSASIIFKGIDGVAYGHSLYNGFFANGADLTGNCTLASTNSNPYSISGYGTSHFSTTSVNLSSPCHPALGLSGQDTLIVDPIIDGGLGPDDIITGFVIRILAEDVAGSGQLDDGSGNAPDDGTPGNLVTATIFEALPSILGFKITGCTFKELERKIFDVDIEATPKFLSRTDNTQYNIGLTNQVIDPLTPLNMIVSLPNHINNIVPGPGGFKVGQNVVFNNITLDRLESKSYYINASLSANAPLVDSVVENVEGVLKFMDQQDKTHPSFDEWNVSTMQPHSGIAHWHASCDTALWSKYLIAKNQFVPNKGSKLKFWHRYNTELHKDGGQVQISTDQGQSWVDLGPYFIQNGYNDYINNEPPNFGFSGSQNSYIESIIDLDTFKFRSCLVRFRLFSDATVATGGWNLDDITLSDLRASRSAYVTATINTITDVDSLRQIIQVVPCTDVYTTLDNGQGTLRRAVSCANSVDTISFLPEIYEDTILLNTDLTIDKSIYLDGRSLITIHQQGDYEIFNIGQLGSLHLKNLDFITSGNPSANMLLNNGFLILDGTFWFKEGIGNAKMNNNGQLEVRSNNVIKN